MRIFNSLADTVAASTTITVDEPDKCHDDDDHRRMPFGSPPVLQDIQDSSTLCRETSTSERPLSRVLAGNDDKDCYPRPPHQQQQRARRSRRTADLLQGQPAFRRVSVWGTEEDRRLPPLSDAHNLDGDDGTRRPNRQHQQVPTDRVPRKESARVSGSCANEQPQPRRRDRPVQLYHGSRLPVPRRQGPAPERIPRPVITYCHASRPRDSLTPAPAHRRRTSCPRRGVRDEPAVKSTRRCTFNLPAARSSSYKVHDVQAPGSTNRSRRDTYDVAPAVDDTQRSRRDTYDVPPVTNDAQRSRRDTYDVAPATNDTKRSRRRDTYDVAPAMNDTQRSRRDTYDVPPATNGTQKSRRDTYNVALCAKCATERLRFDIYDVDVPAPNDPPTDRSRVLSISVSFGADASEIYGGRPDHEVVDIYLNHHANAEDAAPPEVATPGRVCQDIDPAATNVSTPEHWRKMMDDRSSIGSRQALSIDESPVRSDDHRIASRDSRPFGLDDSFAMRQSSRGCSRAASSNGAPLRRNGRRDTICRNTH